VDFGIAKATDNSGMESITRQGLAVGTPHYMAPEQFRPKLGPVGPQSDVYAVGAVLFHLLAGKTPFDADTAHQVLIKAATQDAPPLVGLKTPSDEVIDEDLAAIVKRSMTKELAKRYPSARAFAADLRRYTAGLEVEANPLSGKARLRRQLKKNPGAVTLFGLTGALLFAIAIALVAIGLIWSSRDSQLANSLFSARSVVLSTCKSAAAGADQALVNVQSELVAGSTSIVWITLVGILVFGAALSAVAYRMMSQRLAETLPSSPAARPDEIGQTADEVASKTG
jgi:serine/threonine protein kinase